jgi:hypothetical protein
MLAAAGRLTDHRATASSGAGCVGPAIWQLAVSSLEIVEIDEVAFATGDSLERDKVGQRADRDLHTVHVLGISAGREEEHEPPVLR